jgi:hypothetical protein
MKRRFFAELAKTFVHKEEELSSLLGSFLFDGVYTRWYLKTIPFRVVNSRGQNHNLLL